MKVVTPFHKKDVSSRLVSSQVSSQTKIMAEDLLNTNGNAEVDPAAEFLAREQDELAELGEDFQTEENSGVS